MSYVSENKSNKIKSGRVIDKNEKLLVRARIREGIRCFSTYTVEVECDGQAVQVSSFRYCVPT